MYDLQFVRKRRRRRIAALVSVVSAIGVASLVIISFLGRTFGTFTVSIKNTSVRLALSETDSFENPTSYLRIDNIPSSYYEFSYKWFDRIGMDLIDDEQNDYLYGISGDGVGMYFLKYTFYVKNVGSTTAAYNMYINLDDSTQATNGKTLDDTLRIMVFENRPSDPETHKSEVYAKEMTDYRYRVFDKEGKETHRAFVSETPNPDSEGKVYEDDAHPLAIAFRKGKSVIHYPVDNFVKNDIMRYTVVYWLEGEASYPEFNEEGQPENPPLGAKIKLSIDITASSYNIRK